MSLATSPVRFKDAFISSGNASKNCLEDMILSPEGFFVILNPSHFSAFSIPFLPLIPILEIVSASTYTEDLFLRIPDAFLTEYQGAFASRKAVFVASLSRTRVVPSPTADLICALLSSIILSADSQSASVDVPDSTFAFRLSISSAIAFC